MKEEDIRKRAVFNKYLQLVEQDVKNFFDFDCFEKVNCPACGNSRYKSEFKKNGFEYTSCLSCKTLYVNPRPPLNLLDDFYSTSPSTSFWVNDFFKPVAEIRREKIFRPRMQMIAREFPMLSKARIGDIGAGFGIALEELKNLLPEADLVAIEPSLEMADICKAKGLDVIPTIMENVEESDGNFDLLMSFELFEHLYNPDEFLKKAWKLLKPNGRIIITTLNGQGFDIQVLWNRSKSIFPPHHLNFFNPDSIAHLLEINDFEIEIIDTPGILDWDIVEGMHREENAEIGRLWSLVSGKEKKVKQELQEWITRSNLSSHMRVVARKREVD